MSSSPVLERAKSGRSACRLSGQTIAEGAWRVGLESYRGGRMVMSWFVPEAFLKEVTVGYADNGRASDKATGKIINKGEVRVCYASGSSKSYFRPSSAAPFLGQVAKVVNSPAAAKRTQWALELNGMDTLEPAHKELVAQVLTGDKAASKQPNPSATFETPVKSKAKGKPATLTDEKSMPAASLKRKGPSKVRSSGRSPSSSSNGDTDEEESTDETEDDEEEDEEDEDDEEEEEQLDLVWAKYATNPWWPGYIISEPSSKHMKAPGAPTADTPPGAHPSLVVFFGSRPSWAWVPPLSIAKFAQSRAGLAAKCKTAPFKVALKQADAKQAAQEKTNAGTTFSSQESSRGVNAPKAEKSSSKVDVDDEIEAETKGMSDDEEEGGGGGGEAISDYEAMRLANIARNASFMASLGLGSEKEALHRLGGGSSNGSSASSKGLKRATGSQSRAKKARTASSSVPENERRRSSRNAGMAAEDLFVTSEGRRGTVTVGGSAAAVAAAVKSANDTSGGSGLGVRGVSAAKSRNNASGPLSLSECAGEEGFAQEYVQALSTIASKTGSTDGKKNSGSNDLSIDMSSFSEDETAYGKRMSKLRISEEKVAKVTNDRAYSVALMPVRGSTVVAVGDKVGNLGFWNYSDQASWGDSDGVTQFSPHAATINVLAFAPDRPSKLFSTSYDGTVRCFDMEAQRFDLCYSTPSRTSHDYWLQHSCLTDQGQGLLLGDSAGYCAAVDLRSNKVTWQADCCEKKVQTVAVHPTQPHYFAAASLDRTVRIFDLRKLPSGASAQSCAATQSSTKASSDDFNPPSFEPVSTFQEGNSVNCAYWSPDGGCLLSVTQGNHLRVFANAHLGPSGSHGAAKAAACTVSHDNQTGRYLPVFHACWDPKRPRSFVLGSMSRNPRIVEVFNVSGGSATPAPSSTTSTTSSAAAASPKGKGKSKAVAAAIPSSEALSSSSGPVTCKRVAVLHGEGLSSVQSRHAVHPFHDLIACANASGRVHIFDNE